MSIIAQKPYSTGSGVYLVETINAFKKMGYENAVVYAKYNDDNINVGENVKEYPLIFDTNDLPYLIFGMSDEMPYKSMRYIDMNEKTFDLWSKSFISIIDKAIKKIKPDVIIAHHLYLLTSIVRERYKNIKTIGICHNTDIRQYIKNDFMRDFIKHNINLLDKICVPTSYHKKLVIDLFGIKNEKIEIIGIGYNDKVLLSNLPGVKEYINANVVNANVVYVDLPKLTNADEVSIDEEKGYVKRLADGIIEILQSTKELKVDTSKISWDNVAKMIIE